MDLYDSPPSLSLSPSPRTSVSFGSDDPDSNILIDDHPVYPDPAILHSNVLPAIHLPMPHPPPLKSHSQWPPLPHSHLPPPHHLPSPPYMGELYDPMHMEDMASTNSDSPGASAHCTYPSPPASLFRNPQDWSLGGSAGLHDHMDHSANGSFYRRASYPYVRHDDHHHHTLPGAEHSTLKMEHASPVIVPTQHILPAPNSYYAQPDSRPGSSHSHVSSTGFMPAHPVIHTDDAASKETQFLRRRCFNCHQTEPPSWRRSTLNPGKIVCNKCGLYERTHLRARPHRFDELRASNKARKASQQVAPYPPQLPKTGSPKNRVLNAPPFVKREAHDNGIVHSLPRSRRGSTASSVSSGPGGVSDWDESVSVYNSNSSAASSTYSSPVITPFSIPNHPSPSPSFDGGNSGMPIRLPSNPMVGVNTGGPGIVRSGTPIKSHTGPYYPERRGQADRRYTTGTLPTYDSPPRWEGDVMEKEVKATVG